MGLWLVSSLFTTVHMSLGRLLLMDCEAEVLIVRAVQAGIEGEQTGKVRYDY